MQRSLAFIRSFGDDMHEISYDYALRLPMNLLFAYLLTKHSPVPRRSTVGLDSLSLWL